MLFLGTDKTLFLEHLRKLKRYLLLDNGVLIDTLQFPPTWRVTRLDFSQHTFNPRVGMTYERAEQFADIIDSAFPGGDTTLTKQGSHIALMDALLAKNIKRTSLKNTKQHRTLEDLSFNEKDNDQRAAAQKIRRILLSPILRQVLCNPDITANFRFSGVILARLDLATMSPFDCFLLGNLLISRYPGQVVIPEFGSYAIPSHIQLIRQDRLIAGLDFLEDVERPIRRQLLAGEWIANGTSYEDAVILANYKGLKPDPTRKDNDYNNFIAKCMRNIA